MSTVTEDVFAKALELPQADRADLARRLLSLEPEESGRDPGLEAAWAAEIGRRIRKYESGEAELIPAEEMFEELFESLRRERAS